MIIGSTQEKVDEEYFMGKREEERLCLNGKQHLAEMLDALLPGEQLIVGLCNMDGMQQINDVYGTKTGDTVLAHVEGKLCEAVELPDFVFRLRGDEFVVVFVNRPIRQRNGWREPLCGSMREKSRPALRRSCLFVMGWCA